MKPLLLNLTTSSAYLSFSMNYECREICPQQINTDSHKNLPKGNAKEEEDIRFLKVHCMCSYLSQTDFIQTLRKLVMAFWLAPRRRLTRKSTRHFPWDQWGRGWSFFYFIFPDTGKNPGIQIQITNFSVMAHDWGKLEKVTCVQWQRGSSK